MKRILVTAFATATFSTMAAAADMDPVDTGDFAARLEFEGGYNYAKGNGGAGSIDGFLLGGGGSVSTSFGSLSAQLDAVIRHENFGGNFGGKVTTINGGLHLGYRNPEKVMYGLNVAYGNTNVNGGGGDFNYFRIGGEADYFFNAVSLGGAAGYLNVNPTGAGNSLDAFYFKGTGKYYLHDNFRLAASLGYFDLGTSGGIATLFSSVGAEYKLDNLPISLTARWNGNFINPTGAGNNISGHQILAGFRIYLGGSGNRSIKSYDRNNFADSCVVPGTLGLTFC